MFPLIICNLLLVSLHVSDPTLFIMGQESKITDFQIVRITSKKQLHETWAKHYGVEVHQLDLKLMPYVDVNFETQEVVAVFAGHVIESEGLTPVKIVQFFGSNIVLYKQSRFTEFNRVAEGHPYGFIVLPRIRGEIQVVEQIVTWGGGRNFTYSYKERARLAEAK